MAQQAPDATAVVLQWAQMALERGCCKFLMPADPARANDPKLWRFYDRRLDPRERAPLAADTPAVARWAEELRRAERM